MTRTVEILCDDDTTIDVVCECLWTGWRWVLLEVFDLDGGPALDLSDAERDQAEEEVNKTDSVAEWTDDFDEAHDDDADVGDPSWL